MANLQRQSDQWVKELSQEVEMNDNEHWVSVWGDKKVLEMGGGGIFIKFWMYLKSSNYQVIHLEIVPIVCYMYLITKLQKSVS